MIKILLQKGILLLLLVSFIGNLPLKAQVTSPETIAFEYLLRNIKSLDLTSDDISNAVVKNKVVSKHNRVTHLYLHQQYQGIEVHNAILNINILEDGKVLGIGNRFIKDLAHQVNGTSPTLSMEQAISAVMDHFDIAGAKKFTLKESLGDREAVFDPSGIALEPISVKLVFQPITNQKVRLAWNVIFYELNAQHWWNARVDALTGEVLDYSNQVIHCEFDWNEAKCIEDSPAVQLNSNSSIFCPENTEARNPHQPAILPPVNNAYRVFPLLVESPSHGTRTLVESPADPIASPLGWHDTDGVPGHEYTITRGNNVHAYHDIFDQNRSTGGEPDGGDSLVFDFLLDLAQNRPYTQLDAATTNLFYWNNLIHDLWYQYGFDEQSGNFQANNYDNGGEGNDYVRAEALDGSGTNNANFATPSDGNRPRMQMYLWGGSLPDLEEDGLKVLAPDSIIGTYEYSQAQFGADIPPFDQAIIGNVVLVNDSIEVFSDACESIENADSLAGKIAMIDRGECEFGFKSLAAENAGAIAVIICNNVESNDIFSMEPGAVGSQVSIPTIMIGLENCNRLKTGLPGLEVRLSQLDFTLPLPGPPGRDSDFDNGIIVHEYGHGISNRLTGGPAASDCLRSDEQAGEGWSDWLGLVMTTTPEMTADQPRGIGTYATAEPPSGDGIRTYPYSRDMTVNPHTYGAIEGADQVHFIGSVWCAMIWDLFWNLADEYGYDPDLYYGTGGNNLAMQLVIDGLKMQPCSPTFIDSRDAILRADSINNDAVNACIIWETFARRGLGHSAEPGGREAFDIPPLCTNQVIVQKSAISEAMAGEIITYELKIINGTAEDIVNGIITDQLPTGTTFVPGSASCNFNLGGGILNLLVGDVPSGVIKSCRYQVRLPEAPFSELTFEDGIETGPSNWDFEHPVGQNNWTLTIADSHTGFKSLVAPNEDGVSDQRLIIAEPFDLSGPTAGFSFWHRYDVEQFNDGGVVEISTDGVTWEDLGDKMLLNGYNGTLNEGTQNPLSGRPAFHGNSYDWIQTIIDLSDYTGNQAQIRFRLGCDEARGRGGWFVDDIRFFSSFEVAVNTACITIASEEICDKTTTIVMPPVPTATSDLSKDIIVSLFPNPTDDQITIVLEKSSAQNVELQLLSIDGRQLLLRNFDSFSSEVLNMSPFGPGIYLVQLKTDEGVVTRKVVVE